MKVCYSTKTYSVHVFLSVCMHVDVCELGTLGCEGRVG